MPLIYCNPNEPTEGEEAFDLRTAPKVLSDYFESIGVEFKGFSVYATMEDGGRGRARSGSTCFDLALSLPYVDAAKIFPGFPGCDMRAVALGDGFPFPGWIPDNASISFTDYGTGVYLDVSVSGSIPQAE